MSTLFSTVWADQVHIYDTLGSTNTEAKRLAVLGAPHGTVVIARHQSQGRGRMGRSFSSPKGLGLYLSAILRPNCPPQQLLPLTCCVGVCVCDALQSLCSIRPKLKWINDLVMGKRKLGGILCELSISPETGLVDFAIVGIGINCLHQKTDFPAELQDMATSLAMCTGKAYPPEDVGKALIQALKALDITPAVMDAYRKDCITLNTPVMVLRGDERYYATATDIDPTGSLIVTLPDGTCRSVDSGEVSIRGMYGYC